MERFCKPKENGVIDIILGKEAAEKFAGHRKPIWNLTQRKRAVDGKRVVYYECDSPDCKAVLSLTFLEDSKVHLQQLEIHNHLPVFTKKKREQSLVAAGICQGKQHPEEGGEKIIPGHPHVCDCVTVREGGVAEPSSIAQRVNPPLPTHVRRVVSPRVVDRLAAGRFNPGPGDVVLVCEEAAMRAEELAVRNNLKETPPALAFERLLQDACDITGETVFLLLSKEADAADGSATQPSSLGQAQPRSLLTGQSTRLGAAFLQVGSLERIASIRKNYQTLISLDEKIGSRIKRFKSERDFLMLGYCLILTDQKAVGPGYAAAVRFEDEAELHPSLLSDILGKIADDVWAEVLERIPELEAFSSKVISEGSRGFTIGRTPFNMASLAKNQIVEFHLNLRDAHWTVLVWLHGGEGPIQEGWFGLPAFGLQFLPTTLTVAVFNAASITHGTAPCVIPEGSSACRFGSSHFLRMPDLENLICLRIGADSNGLTLQDLRDAAANANGKAGRRAISTLRKELIASGRAEFRQSGGGQQAWRDAAVEWRDWNL
ncbi:hypothetical protein Vretifemale_6515 [Volvox reticuliferus]|uniref:Uncharacterized protein n=2 Tax=Volvox reticuliferus TaxID=1737510 RepID=A0A8J4FIV0_9CHLO|nr:hypothetical protein Vretifemale_6515 [Volvox reticuliferus]